MTILYRFKTGDLVEVVSHCSNKIMEPRTKQTVIQL